MHGTWESILGRTIKAVVTAENLSEPQSQVFIVFTDGSSFEIFGQNLRVANKLDRGGIDATVKYAEEFGGTVQVIDESPTGLDVDSRGRDSSMMI